MITAIALLSFLAWVYLMAFRGGFWHSSPVLKRSIDRRGGKVAVIVPARDEAENIRQSIGSLLEQDYAGELSIIVVDDNSSDGTGALAASLDCTERLTVIQGAGLPAGWSGKLWAVHQGLSHSRALNSDFVLLTDADIVHSPDHVSSLAHQADAARLDLVSEMVRLKCSTAAERALIPAFVFFFQMLYPFAWVADPAKRTAGAAGGTMLVRRWALDRVEGMQRIRENLIDDCALAREIKSSGGRIWLGHAEGTVSLRAYDGWGDVWKMIARTAYVQLRHSLLMLLGCVVAMCIIYCAPPLLAVFAHGRARMLGIAAWALMAIAFQPTLRRYRQNPLWGLALPVIALFYLCATVASAFRHYSGRGGAWKNRVYPDAPRA